MFKKFLKFLLYLLIISLITAVVVGGAILLDRPLEEAGILLAVIFGGWLAFVIIRKLILRYRARAQAKRVINEAAAPVDDLGMTPTQLLRNVRQRWRGALRVLKKSNLRLKGDPLYVLPWYLVMGKPTSGKSTSLRNAHLISPSTPLSAHEDGSTLNIEWWLYDQAIVIDTAGRYAVPGNEKRDRKEWQSIMSLLARNKQKEPLNGIVVVVAADRLIEYSEEDLLEEGRNVRASINDLMTTLEAKVPVYLMVTKCDLIDGFKAWTQYLPEDALMQAMGCLIDIDETDIDAAVDRALDTVTQRMKELRLLMLERSREHDDSLLNLPNEMEKLRAGLHAFCTTAINKNLYTETPGVRGVFFSSAVQDELRAGVKKKSRGMFLNHLFTRILPKDRPLLDSLPSAIRLRRAAQAYALSIGGAITLLIVMGLTGVYLRDTDTLATVYANYEPIDTRAPALEDRLVALSRLRELVTELRAAEDEWIVPWYFFAGGSPDVRELTAKYVSTVRKLLKDDVDGPLGRAIVDARGTVIADLVSGVARRISLLKIRQNPDAQDAEQPAVVNPVEANYLLALSPNLRAENAELFDEIYRSYIEWIDADLPLSEEQTFLHGSLIQLVGKTRGDFNWIIQSINQREIPPVQLVDFWSGTVAIPNPIKVDAAYTLTGRENVLEFLAEIRDADAQEQELTGFFNEFGTHYERNYISAWFNFVSRFDQGIETLRDRREWLLAVESMSTPENPYFRVMEEVTEQLEPFDVGDNFPSKVNIDFFKDMQAYAPSDDAGGGGGGKVAKLGLKLLGKTGKAGKALAKAGKTGLKASKKAKKLAGKSKEDLENVIEPAAKELANYKKALEEVAFNAESLSQSFTATSAFFSAPEAPESGDGAVGSAWKAVIALQKLIGRPKPSSALFWDLFLGPMRIARQYMLEETGCYMNESWKDTVLAEIEGVEQSRVGKILIGETGLVWGYLENEAKAFVGKRASKGFMPVEIGGDKIEFTNDFINFINNASGGKFIVESEFTVRLDALPTGVNHEAAVAPYATYLDLHCADGVQTLENYNYIAGKDFLWSIEKCGDVSLRIEIGPLTLRKNYSGPKGFSSFLADFQDGRRVFVVDDFPQQAAQLRKDNVRAIDVSYRIRGQEPVLNALNSVPLSAPPTAAACWAN